LLLQSQRRAARSYMQKHGVALQQRFAALSVALATRWRSALTAPPPAAPRAMRYAWQWQYQWRNNNQP